MSFTRANRLWELLLPGDQTPPSVKSDFVQPTFDLLAPRVGECFIRREQVTAVSAAGSQALVFTSPPSGRIQLPRTLATFSDTAIVANCYINVDIGDLTSTNPPDRWGVLAATILTSEIPTNFAGTRMAVSAGQHFSLKVHLPQIITRGNAIVVTWVGPLGGENLRADLTFIDCPGELVPLTP